MPVRTIVRCKLNKFETPLFSFDANGIYLRCKDCRRDTQQGVRRGTYHLISWAQLNSMMLSATNGQTSLLIGTGGEQHDKPGEVAGTDLELTQVNVNANDVTG